jgi:mitogen-activated protein kinase 1/3
VVLAKHLPTGEMVAIKKLDEVFFYVKDAKRILREIILLRELNNHRNVIRLYDIIVPEDS